MSRLDLAALRDRAATYTRDLAERREMANRPAGDLNAALARIKRDAVAMRRAYGLPVVRLVTLDGRRVD